MTMYIATALLALSCGPRDSTEAEEPAPPREDPRLSAVSAALSALDPEAARDIGAAVRAAPDRFFELLEALEAESAAAGGLLVLVDKRTPLPPGYEPADLVSLNEYPLEVTRKDLRLRKVVMGPALEMARAARAAGVRLVFASAYRSYEYQDGLFKRYSATHGEAEASRFSARPGTSQHQLGEAIDFSPIEDEFAETAAGEWTAANAWRFGFSMSYPPGMESVTGYVWESWHFRYVTKPGALLEREYFGGVQQYLAEFLAAFRRPAP